jgi:hypothetical protein
MSEVRTDPPAQIPITDAVRLFSGYHFRSAIRDYPQGPLPVLQVNDFDRQGRFDADQLARIQPDFDPSPYLLDEGDVLFLARGGRNWARTAADAAGMITPGYFYILRPDIDRADPVYLAWWLNSPGAQRQIGSAQRGSKIRFIPLSEFRSLTVALPPLTQQRRIAELHGLATREYAIMTRLRDARASLADALALAAATAAATGAASE